MFFIVFYINCSQFNKQFDVEIKFKILFMKKNFTNADNINIVEKIFSNSLQSGKIVVRFVFIVFNNESISSFSNSNENFVSSKNKIVRAHIVKKIFFKNNVFDDMQNDETFQMKSSLRKFTFFFKKIRKIISNNNKTRVNLFNAILLIDNNNFTSSSQLQMQIINSRIDFFQFIFIVEKKLFNYWTLFLVVIISFFWIQKMWTIQFESCFSIFVLITIYIKYCERNVFNHTNNENL